MIIAVLVHTVKDMVFPVLVYSCESWTIQKPECWRSDALVHCGGEEDQSPLDYKDIKPVNPKGNQSWVFIGRTDAEAEAPILWTLDVKNWLTGKDADAEKDWREKEKRVAEDEMIR